MLEPFTQRYPCSAQVAAKNHDAPLPALGAGGRPPNGAAVKDWDPWGVGMAAAANGEPHACVLTAVSVQT